MCSKVWNEILWLECYIMAAAGAKDVFLPFSWLTTRNAIPPAPLFWFRTAHGLSCLCCSLRNKSKCVTAQEACIGLLCLLPHQFLQGRGTDQSVVKCTVGRRGIQVQSLATERFSTGRWGEKRTWASGKLLVTSRHLQASVTRMQSQQLPASKLGGLRLQGLGFTCHDDHAEVFQWMRIKPLLLFQLRTQEAWWIRPWKVHLVLWHPSLAIWILWKSFHSVIPLGNLILAFPILWYMWNHSHKLHQLLT